VFTGAQSAGLKQGCARDVEVPRRDRDIWGHRSRRDVTPKRRDRDTLLESDTDTYYFQWPAPTLTDTSDTHTTDKVRPMEVQSTGRDYREQWWWWWDKCVEWLKSSWRTVFKSSAESRQRLGSDSVGIVREYRERNWDGLVMLREKMMLAGWWWRHVRGCK